MGTGECCQQIFDWLIDRMGQVSTQKINVKERSSLPHLENFLLNPDGQFLSHRCILSRGQLELTACGLPSLYSFTEGRKQQDSAHSRLVKDKPLTWALRKNRLAGPVLALGSHTQAHTEERCKQSSPVILCRWGERGTRLLPFYNKWPISVK